jgi:hypothetical protein
MRAASRLTRRKWLQALAATTLVGCAGEEVERANTTPATADATESSEPAWVSAVPTLSFSEGSASAYDLRQHTQRFDPTRHEMVLATGATALPPGMALDPKGWLRYDGSKPGGSVSGVVIDIRDIARAGASAGPHRLEGMLT